MHDVFLRKIYKNFKDFVFDALVILLEQTFDPPLRCDFFIIKRFLEIHKVRKNSYKYQLQLTVQIHYYRFFFFFLNKGKILLVFNSALL